MSTQRCLIVPAADAELAAYLTRLASAGGGGMFEAALTEPDADEPTHRFSNAQAGQLYQQFAALLPLDQWDDDTGQYVRIQPGSAAAIAAITGDTEAIETLQTAGYPVPQPECPEHWTRSVTIAEVQALLDAAVITGEGWQVTAARLGLTLAP